MSTCGGCFKTFRDEGALLKHVNLSKNPLCLEDYTNLVTMARSRMREDIRLPNIRPNPAPTLSNDALPADAVDPSSPESLPSSRSSTPMSVDLQDPHSEDMDVDSVFGVHDFFGDDYEEGELPGLEWTDGYAGDEEEGEAADDGARMEEGDDEGQEDVGEDVTEGISKGGEEEEEEEEDEDADVYYW